MTQRRTHLTQAQWKAIEALVTEGATQAQAARAAGVGVYQINKWMKDLTFVTALDRAYKQVEDDTWRRMKAHARHAAETLIDVMSDTKVRHNIRVSAANSILDRSGFAKAQEKVEEVDPFSSRDDLLAALSGFPADVLVEALRRATHED